MDRDSVQAVGSYPYDKAWKDRVDHESPDWMAYCETVSLIKRYLRTRAQYGRTSAVEEFEATCANFSKNNARGAARAVRIRDDFRRIWAHERHDLAAQVAAEEERQAA